MPDEYNLPIYSPCCHAQVVYHICGTEPVPVCPNCGTIIMGRLLTEDEVVLAQERAYNELMAELAQDWEVSGHTDLW